MLFFKLFRIYVILVDRLSWLQLDRNLNYHYMEYKINSLTFSGFCHKNHLSYLSKKTNMQ